MTAINIQLHYDISSSSSSSFFSLSLLLSLVLSSLFGYFFGLLLFEQYKKCFRRGLCCLWVVFFLVDHITMNCFCSNSGITVQNLDDFFVDIFAGLIAPNEICMSPSIIGNNVIKHKGNTKCVDDISRIFEFSNPIVL